MEAELQQKQRSFDAAFPSSPAPIQLARPKSQPLPLPAHDSYSTWEQVGAQLSEFIAGYPNLVGKTLLQYQSLIVTIILILSAMVTLKVIVAILNSVNEIPLLPSTFELIGIGYSTWFTVRYLIRASTRQELSTQFSSIKSEIIGK
ncbi:MAG: CAAD domain-containing protein [Scytonema sp. PMC 1069.18]|nr:CAAD domain-containing protein [Scytonema sp. PMC 1069.18]MEC4886571.1 CAAD domain-containing protein [Scytonema sp. PMC 1070.18]